MSQIANSIEIMPDAKKGAALVTGGAVRLGKSLALCLAKAGYDIALHFHSSRDAAQATAEAIREFGVQCELLPFDLSVERDMSILIGRAHARFPKLNVLVNSASVYESATILQTDAELLEKQFKVNFQAPFLLTKSFAQTVEFGCVINIIDNKILFHQNQYAAYLLSKKALADFTPLAAVELAPRIRVNGIAPGVILPAETRSADYIKWRVRGIPAQQQGRLDHISQSLHYLLENTFVTGQILVVDGGESLTNNGLNAASYEQMKKS